MKPLPDHIIQKNENFYWNTKTKKWIHKDHIEDFLETYWSYRSRGIDAVKAKVREKQNIKYGKKRWDL